MNAFNMESSDEEVNNGDTWNSHQSSLQRQLVGHHFRQGILNEVLTIQVYDIRNNFQISPVKYETFTTDSIESCDIIIAIANRYDVSRDLVNMDTRYNEAVICEEKDIHILFISFRASHDSRAPNSQYTDLACIGLEKGTSVGKLKTLISESECFQMNESVSLFAKGNRLEDDDILDICIKPRGRLLCIEEKYVSVSCYHRPRRKTENKYTLECRNTSNVSEVKTIFRRTFSTDFPSLLTGSDEMWFTQGKHVLKDKEFLFINKSGRLSLHETGRILVHIKPASSFPITVKIHFSQENREQETFALIVSPETSLEELRVEISASVDRHQHSLQLVENNKKIRSNQDLHLTANCTVVVKIKSRIQLKVLVDEGSDSTLRTVSIRLYKLDFVITMKRALAEKLNVDSRDLKLMFNTTELIDEKRLQDYRIKDNDTLCALFLQDTIHLQVRQPGQRVRYLTVQDFRNTSVHSVKKYLAQALGGDDSKMSLIHMDKCLDNEDTLYESGLMSGEIIMVPRQDRTQNERLRIVFVDTPNSWFNSVYAVEEQGVLFYAPETIPITVLESRISSYKVNQPVSLGMVISSFPGLPNSPRGSTSSSSSLHHCYRTLFGVGSSVDSETGNGFASGSPNKMVDEEQVSARYQGRTLPTLAIPERYEGGNALKRLTMSKELTREGDKVILRESSFYEEDVSNDSESQTTPFTRTMIPTSSECDTSDATSPLVKTFRSASLIFPPQVVKNSVLNAVSVEMGHDWKRVALTLGLLHTDLENLEYRYHGNLQEQALHALILWKQRYSKTATLEKLKDALKECGLVLIADAVVDED